VRFTDLETDPLEVIGNIYKQLQIPGYVNAKAKFINYLDKMKAYQKNEHSISKQEFDQVQKELGFFIEKYQYSTPENVEIKSSSL